VVDYDEHTIREALHRLSRRRLVRLASGHSSRATKYRHLLDDTLSLDNPSLALLCVLMLRGPQTPGELKQRSERLHPFPDLASIEVTLDSLAERGLARRLERRPGQKEQRYRHLLSEDEDDEPAEPASAPAAPSTPAPPAYDHGSDQLERRIDALEREVAELRGELASLREQLGG
jgi:uncharacterized protein YceH (UPF0502 family)